MAIRAKELAEMLGVSQATISLVLNRKAGLSEKTRKELTDKICGMGLQYMPPLRLVMRQVRLQKSRSGRGRRRA